MIVLIEFYNIILLTLIFKLRYIPRKRKYNIINNLLYYHIFYFKYSFSIKYVKYIGT